MFWKHACDLMIVTGAGMMIFEPMWEAVFDVNVGAVVSLMIIATIVRIMIAAEES